MLQLSCVYIKSLSRNFGIGAKGGESSKSSLYTCLRKYPRRYTIVRRQPPLLSMASRTYFKPQAKYCKNDHPGITSVAPNLFLAEFLEPSNNCIQGRLGLARWAARFLIIRTAEALFFFFHSIFQQELNWPNRSYSDRIVLGIFFFQIPVKYGYIENCVGGTSFGTPPHIIG